MKVQIRQGIFETNSSSTHAICVAKKHKFDKYKLPKKLFVPNCSFGWEPEIHYDTGTKASYLFQTIRYVFWGDEHKQTQYNKKICDTLRQYGIECEFESGDYGYIDHGGEGDMRRWLDDMVSDPDALMTYLFGDSVIVTGNDNDYEFDKEMRPFLGLCEDGYPLYDYDKYNKKYSKYDIYEKEN